MDFMFHLPKGLRVAEPSDELFNLLLMPPAKPHPHPPFQVPLAWLSAGPSSWPSLWPLILTLSPAGQSWSVLVSSWLSIFAPPQDQGV